MSDLRKLYVAADQGDAHVLRGLLEAAGIAAVIRGDEFVPLQGGSWLQVDTRPSLWVLEDERYPDAVAIAEDYRRGRTQPPPEGGSWACRACGEQLEEQFGACWACGAERA